MTTTPITRDRRWRASIASSADDLLTFFGPLIPSACTEP
jgi:hypothetical protein